MEKADYLKRQMFNMICWIPGHVGMTGNEKADRASKEALGLKMTAFQIPSSDVKPEIIIYF